MKPNHDELLALVKKLEPPPAVLSSILDVCARPSHGRDEVSKIIGADPAIAGAVLRLANSPAYATRAGRQLSSIDHAVGILGEEEVVRLVMAMCARMLEAGAPGYGMVGQALWHRSLRSALAAAAIAARVGYEREEEAYCAGLFLDVGKLVLSRYVAKMSYESDASFDAYERECVGADHAELAATITELWRLPEPVCVAVRFHHQPSEAPEAFQLISFIAHLADGIAALTGDASAVDAMGYALDGAFGKRLGLRQPDVMQLMFEVSEEFDAVLGSMRSQAA